MLMLRILMLSNTNTKQCKCQAMLSNAKHMVDKYTEHAEHILCTCLQYADDGQCTLFSKSMKNRAVKNKDFLRAIN